MSSLNARLAIALGHGTLAINLSKAEELLRKGADPDADIRYGPCEFLHQAVKYTDLDTVRLLLKYGANPNGDPPFTIFNLLIDARFEDCSAYHSEALELTCQCRLGEITRRQWAVRSGKLKRRYEQNDFHRIRIDIAKALIDAGAEVNHFCHPIETAATYELNRCMGLAWLLMLYCEIDWSLVEEEVREGQLIQNWIEFVEMVRQSDIFKAEGVSCLYNPGYLLARVHPEFRKLAAEMNSES